MDFCLFQPSTLTHFLSSPPTLIPIFLPLKIELKIYTSLPCLHSLRPIRFDIMGTVVTISVILLHHRARKVVYKKFFELWLAVEPLTCSPFTAYLPFCYHSPNSFQSESLPFSWFAWFTLGCCLRTAFIPSGSSHPRHALRNIYVSVYVLWKVLRVCRPCACIFVFCRRDNCMNT